MLTKVFFWGELLLACETRRSENRCVVSRPFSACRESGYWNICEQAVQHCSYNNTQEPGLDILVAHCVSNAVLRAGRSALHENWLLVDK